MDFDLLGKLLESADEVRVDEDEDGNVKLQFTVRVPVDTSGWLMSQGVNE